MQTHAAPSTPAAASGTQHSARQPTSLESSARVGQDAAGMSVLRRRVKFLARFIYWAIRHRSLSSAAWVCNYEGLYW